MTKLTVPLGTVIKYLLVSPICTVLSKTAQQLLTLVGMGRSGKEKTGEHNSFWSEIQPHACMDSCRPGGGGRGKEGKRGFHGAQIKVLFVFA